MPRVLYICHGHPALTPGGTETVAHDLFATIRERPGFDAMFVGCVSPLHRPPRPGTRFQTLSRSADEMLLWVGPFDRFMLAQTDVAAFAEAFGELLSSFRPDVVHFHHLSRIGLEALPLVRRLLPAAAMVMTLHDYFAICANDGLMTCPGTGKLCREARPDACHACFPEIPSQRFVARGLHLRNLLGLVDRFIAPSAFLRDRYVVWGLPEEKIQIVANGVPCELPAPAGRRARRTFGFFGNIAPHKGVLLALEAARALAQESIPIKLRLHGDLNFQPEAFRRAFADALALARPNAEHLGAYIRSDLPALMAEVDWVVVPSIWWENAPLVVLEAFRHGRPVICSDIGGMAELVHDRVDGLHFRAGDATDLARVMRRAAREPGLWRRLVDGLPRPPTPAEIADRHLALYRSPLRQEEATLA